MKLQIIAALVGPILRSLGQRDLAVKLADAINELAGRMRDLEAKQVRLEEKYQKLGADIERMLRARGVAGLAPDDYERRLAAIEEQIKSWEEDGDEPEEGMRT